MAEALDARVAADGLTGRLTAVLLFLSLALALVLPNALDVGLSALVLLALLWLVRHGRGQWRSLHRVEWLLLAAPLIFVVAWLLAWALHGLPEAGIGSAQRLPKLLAVVPLFLFLRRVEGLDAVWWNGLVAGSLIAGGYALWFTLSGQTGDYGSRVEGPTNPIYFGGFAMAYALMLIPRLADERQSGAARSLAGIAIIMAFVANALSGSRGAWLAIPILLAIYLFTAGARQPVRWRLGVPLMMLALSLVVLLVPTLPMSDRLGETLQELSLAGNGQDSFGGIGLRLQMWEIAAGLIGEHPWTGTGAGSFRLALVESVQVGQYDPTLLRYAHPHNQYLSALVDGGAGLLAALVVLLTAPLLAVSPLSRTHSRQCRYLAWCALAATVTFAVLAVSESLFERNAGITWFAFLAAASTALATGSTPSIAQRHEAPGHH